MGFRPGAGNGAAVIASIARECGADLHTIGRGGFASVERRTTPFNLEVWFAELDLSGVNAALSDEDWADLDLLITEVEDADLEHPAGSPDDGAPEFVAPDIALRASDLRSKMFRASSARPILTSRYLVKGWLDRGALAMVYGPSNVGKSFLVLDVANHVAEGRPWNGCSVWSGPVFYLVAEGARSFQNRLTALDGGASDNLHVYRGTVLRQGVAPVMPPI